MAKSVLVVGSGGREHSLAWKLRQSPRVDKLYIAPGNAGTEGVGENIPIKATSIDELLYFVEEKRVDITVVGPEQPLQVGIVDSFRSRGHRIFGPTREAAEIETSKIIGKQLMAFHSIPTAPFRIFLRYDKRRYEKALKFVRAHGAPIVVKASGPALGKGVYPCLTLAEAEWALYRVMLGKVHGDAGDEVVIEDFLKGQEVSIHAFSGGSNFELFPPSQDHKCLLDDDKGPNTGGMGAFAPVPWVSSAMMEEISETVVKRCINGLRRWGHPFKGCLYPGLMMTEEGPKVLEFNARLGDPEAEVYMRLLKTDLLDFVEACIDGALPRIPVEWHAGFAVSVVLASAGYPDKTEVGKVIHGLEEAEGMPGVVVFHAGTRRGNGQLITAGGRVLTVTAVGSTLEETLGRAYSAVRLIRFDGMQYRKDIGAKAI